MAETRRYTTQEWEEQKAEIERLWESGTLENLVVSMRQQHGFEATPKQYKDRIKKWGLKKNIQSNEMIGMIQKQKEREAGEGKQTGFKLWGRPVDQSRIERYKRDHGINEDAAMSEDAAPTPAGLTYYTPADTGPAIYMSPEAPSSQTSSTPLPASNAETSDPELPPLPPCPPQMLSGPPQGYGQPQYGRPGMPSVNSNGYLNGDYHALPPPPSSTQSFGGGAPQSYGFKYSNCTGRRKALLIGINYFHQRGQLRRCINDIKNMSSFLHDNFGYRRDDMVILTDDQQNLMSQPTKQNILRAMHWLAKDAKANDSLFFHYSGHGGQTKDLDGDKDDGYNEAIYPVDFQRSGHIVDDEMHRIMVQPLEAGVRLTVIFDSCHSGTALDLPYIYSTQGILKEPNLAKEAGKGLLGVISQYSQGDLGEVSTKLMGLFKKAQRGDDAYNKKMATKTSPADVIIWSGSRDYQTSADATIAAQATGAMSWAFINALKKNPQQSMVQLLNSIRDELAAKYNQKPQLSCSHPLDTNLLFVM